MKQRHVVAKTDDIAPGGKLLVQVKGRDIGVFNVGGEFFALSDNCPHAGGSLCGGLVASLVLASEPGAYRVERQGEFVRCPMHGWEFDIKTGQSWCDPQSVRARKYKLEVEPGSELARGPYVAETFPVTLEDNYIVIEL